ncbi:group II intron maturase-specific domain-containing protein, partial [Halalkalibacterium halodurans]
IRELTSRRHSMKMSDRLRRLNRYLTGWLGYYQLVDTPSILAQIDAWIRRRLRMIRWKEWKTPSARQKNLVRLGIKKAKAWQWANSRKGYWRVAHSPIMDYALNSEYWKGQGLMSLAERYQTRRWT